GASPSGVAGVGKVARRSMSEQIPSGALPRKPLRWTSSAGIVAGTDLARCPVPAVAAVRGERSSYRCGPRASTRQGIFFQIEDSKGLSASREQDEVPMAHVAGLDPVAVLDPPARDPDPAVAHQ